MITDRSGFRCLEVREQTICLLNELTKLEERLNYENEQRKEIAHKDSHFQFTITILNSIFFLANLIAMTILLIMK